MYDSPTFTIEHHDVCEQNQEQQQDGMQGHRGVMVEDVEEDEGWGRGEGNEGGGGCVERL